VGEVKRYFAMNEAKFRLMLALLGVTAFILLLGLELFTQDEAISALDVVQEALEIGLTVAVAVAMGMLAGRVHAQREERVSLLRDLNLARAEGAVWRRKARSHIDGLGVVIEEQMEQWGLTAAEREIGLLMLKGFVHKEIAALRATTEATVRHQAWTIYQKAGVEGRAGFCAFFLEDLLPAAGRKGQTASGPVLPTPTANPRRLQAGADLDADRREDGA
jgi:DNA-binding CsgD family transcriptional regulator